MPQVSPSLLSADFTHLDREIEMLNESQAEYIHLDVMDGIFVPNITFGFPVISALSKIAKKPLDTHLMIQNPERYISQVRDCGSEIMNVHIEATSHLHRAIQQIKQAGMKAAVTLNPSTPVILLEDIITDLDMVLIMSVNPGFSGQKFISEAVNKVKRLRKLIADSGSKALIEVDGGINLETGALVTEAGADILVAGNFVFKADDPKRRIAELHNIG